MSQPPEQQPQQPQQPQQWWQPPANPGNQQQGWQQEGQATGPHAGQWQQNDAGAATGSYTGQWQQAPQPGVTGSFSGPWQQTGAPAQGQAWQPQPQPQQPMPQQQDWQAPHQIPGTPPQGQYGGGFQPAQSSQYGGLGAFGAEPEKKPKVSKKTLLIGGIAAVVLIGGGVGAWLLGAFAGDSLDQKSVQDGVVRVLNEHYGEPDVKNAECPSGQPVVNGTTFDCSIDLSGQRKKVTVRVLNTTPEFEIGAPH
ncbi:DUF4333 domain-containing protein [Amycolatopsis sp. BJA-103]|uniref:DUF4333 domain-containing protein n=1 Tax=Amycolatopsis sp. BJA-103 TaxID=1911175 RepID=UPI000C76DD03|nr:DUF4333 domain-containing protein [Amycolatopsis sp. BJA-103]AUI63324.1 hypothetical protein BKN51_37715 [Amycolatopsis sp. BJA-103]PNE19168.1 hypothetical protein B1H26_15425 [Amycolatopsis sp. BJA-103]